MKLENLPDGGHEKLIWKRNRDRTRDKASQQRISETWRRRTVLLSVSFGTYMRRRRHVLMGRRGYVPLRRLGDVPLRRLWVFHLRLIWDVVETYWWDVVITPPWAMRRHHDIPIRRREDVPLRRLGDVPLRRHWVFCLRRTWEVAGTYRETSLRRRHDVFLPGGLVLKRIIL